MRRLARAPISHALTILVIALSLALPTLLYRIVADVSVLASAQAKPPQLTVFVRQDASEADIRRLRDSFAVRTDVAEVRYVPPAQALKEIQQRTGLDDVLAGLDHNPLPPAFILRPVDGQPDSLNALRDRVRHLPGVDQVQLDAEWARRLYALTSFLRQTVLMLGLVLAAGVVSLVVNTVRLQILAAREELEVCKLMGASDAFVRRPFLYLGMLQMVLGVALALGFEELARQTLNQVSADVLGAYGFEFRLKPPPTEELLTLLGVALLSGWLAAAGATAGFLRALRPR